MGFEDIPRDEDQLDKVNPLFQDIPGIPEEVKGTPKRTTMPALMLDINRTSRLVKEFTLADVTLNATRSSTPASHLEKGFTWHNFWEYKRLSPRMIGWNMLAMAGVIILSIYAYVVLCVRRCCVFVNARMSRRREEYPRALPLEPEHKLTNLDNLSTVNNVNLYEVVPVQVAPVAPLSH